MADRAAVCEGDRGPRAVRSSSVSRRASAPSRLAVWSNPRGLTPVVVEGDPGHASHRGLDPASAGEAFERPRGRPGDDLPVAGRRVPIEAADGTQGEEPVAVVQTPDDVLEPDPVGRTVGPIAHKPLDTPLALQVAGEPLGHAGAVSFRPSSIVL